MKKLIDKLKKMSKKMLLLVIAIAVVLVATVTAVLIIVFNSDTDAPAPEGSETDTIAQEGPGGSSDGPGEAEEPSFPVNINEYKVIYDDKANDRVAAVATKFAQKSTEALGVDEVVVDMDNEWNIPQAKEILIGIVSERAESKTALEKTEGKFTYSISIINDKICVAAPTAELLEEALDYLYDECISKSTGDGTFPYKERLVDYTPEEKAHITVVDKGNCLFNVIYPRTATVGTPISVAAMEIREFLQSYTNEGQEVVIANDYANSMGEFDLTQPAFVLGNTDYPRSAELASNLTYFKWRLEYLDKQFYLFSEDTASAVSLRETMLDMLAQGVYLNGSNTIRVSIPEVVEGYYADWCDEIPEYVPVAGEDDVTQDIISEFTEGYYRIYFNHVTPEGWASYKDLVKKSGYTVYQENSITNGRYTSYEGTYMGTNTVLHMYYVGYQKALHVLVCEKSNFIQYATAPTELPAVTTPSLTLMDMDYEKQGAKDNGMGLIYTLKDGSYVIYDGGYSYDTEKLYNYLKDNNKYKDANGAETIYIRAWVLTHPHLDHYGNFTAFADQYARLVKLDNVVYQFDYEGAMNPNQTAGGTSGSVELKKVFTYVKSATLKFVGAKTLTPLAGQTLYFGDLKMEILATSEMLYPNVTTNGNDHSLISRVTLAGNTFLITGDTASSTMHMNTIVKVYGSYLESDFMTAPHHGLNGTSTLYNTVKPSYVIFPTQTDDFEKRISVEGGYEFNRTLVAEYEKHQAFLRGDATEDGYVKEMIVADLGEYNGYKVMYLPFMGSDYYESDFENGNYDGGNQDREDWDDLIGQ